MSKEIKAQEIEGFEICSYEEWEDTPPEDSGQLFISCKNFYYKRIKPKEKSIEDIVDELFPEDIFNSEARKANVKLLKWIDENYIKKEG